MEVPLSAIQSPSFSISMRNSMSNTQENSNIWSNDDLENRYIDYERNVSVESSSDMDKNYAFKKD